MRTIASLALAALSLGFVCAQESVSVPDSIKPSAPPTQPEKPLKFEAMLTTEPLGKAAAKFYTSTPNIYARWEGHGLREQAKIRVLWIAENIGDIAPPNYTIDEANTIAPAADAHGTFVLSKPDGGWAPGDYRVEFSVDDDVVETVKLKIEK